LQAHKFEILRVDKKYRFTSNSLFNNVKSNLLQPGWLSRYSDLLRAGWYGIEYRWGRDFLHSSTPVLGLLYTGYRVFPGVKRPRRGADHPAHLGLRIKKM